MTRYSGSAVTHRNPYVSREDNTVDPNDDENPLFNAGIDAGHDDDFGDDFEVAGADLVAETKADFLIEGKVSEQENESENIVEELKTGANVIDALVSVSAEMRLVMADKGYMSTGEHMALRNVIASLESAMPSLATVETAIPSMEDFKITGLEYSNTSVSMEGVMDRIKEAKNNLGLNIARLFKNAIGLANSITPLINSQLKRAELLRGMINDARRDEGEKEVSGRFVKNLLVDGSAPDATTLLKTAGYLGEVSKEVLSFESINLAGQHLEAALKFIDSGVDFTKLEKPSMWLLFVIYIAKAVKYIEHPLSSAVVAAGNAAESEVNRRVFDKLRVTGDMAPQLFKLFPSVAKVNVSGESKNLDAKRSLPLFGNTVISVSQYAPDVNMTLGHVDTPELTLVKAKKWNNKSAGNTIQSLNPSQQADAISSAVTILEHAREYYKNYAARNGKCMEIYQRAYKLKVAAREESKANGFASADGYVLPVYNFYTRMYWSGIFDEQGKIAQYSRRSAKALLDLVVASAKITQSDVVDNSEDNDVEGSLEAFGVY